MNRVLTGMGPKCEGSRCERCGATKEIPPRFYGHIFTVYLCPFCEVAAFGARVVPTFSAPPPQKNNVVYLEEYRRQKAEGKQNFIVRS